MQYMGGKARIAKKLTEVMLSMTTERTFYLEPFMGGAYVLAQMAPHFSAPAGGDVMPGLAAYWSAIQQGWTPPESMTLNEYQALKDAPMSPLKIFAGFGCSFGGKWFGGYGRQNIDPKHPTGHVSHGSRKTSLAKRSALERVFLVECSYERWSPRAGTVVYCDPPYANTTTYNGTSDFDSSQFWVTMRQWASDGAIVFVSEYAAPDPWRCVWETATPASLKATDNTSTVTEKLFTL